MPIARSSLAGAATGVVLLAGAVGFGVGLPEVVENPGASSAEVPTLPDRLDDRFIALSSVTAEDVKATTPEEIAQAKAIVDGSAASEKKAAARLGDTYGEVAVRTYLDIPATIDPNAQVRPPQIAITIAPGEGGPLIPHGPFEFDQSGTHYELTEVKGFQCSSIWAEAVDPTTGLPTGAERTGASYQEVECRTVRSGLTYDIYSSGITPDEAAHYLDLVLEQTAKD